MALRPFTKTEFEALWRSILPADYTDPIETEAQSAGFDVPSLQSAIFAEFERNANISQQAYFLRRHSIQTGERAASGAKARTTLQLYRAAPALGDVLIHEGKVFLAEAQDSLGGSLALGRFLAVSAVTLPQGQSGPVAVLVEAEFEGYAGNVWEGTILRAEPEGRLSVPAIVSTVSELRRSVLPAEQNADRFNLGMVGRMIRLVPSGVLVTPDAGVPRRVVGAYEASGETVLQFAPPLLAGDLLAPVTVELEELEDVGVSVTQPAPATGGRVDVLSAVAGERKVERSTNETDADFADRLVELPDVVSPNAIERILKRILEPYGVRYCLHETGDVDGLMGFTWGVHPWDYGTACGCGTVEPPGSALIGSGIVWMSAGTSTRFFLICMGRVSLEQLGFAWDSSDTNNPYPAAWGVMIWDGFDAAFNELAGRVYDAIDAAREAGVGFAIVLDETL